MELSFDILEPSLSQKEVFVTDEVHFGEVLNNRCTNNIWLSSLKKSPNRKRKKRRKMQQTPSNGFHGESQSSDELNSSLVKLLQLAQPCSVSLERLRNPAKRRNRRITKRADGSVLTTRGSAASLNGSAGTNATFDAKRMKRTRNVRETGFAARRGNSNSVFSRKRSHPRVETFELTDGTDSENDTPRVVLPPREFTQTPVKHWHFSKPSEPPPVAVESAKAYAVLLERGIDPFVRGWWELQFRKDEESELERSWLRCKEWLNSRVVYCCNIHIMREELKLNIHCFALLSLEVFDSLKDYTSLSDLTLPLASYFVPEVGVIFQQ